MGQQQLLLIILGVIIVGIAISVGIAMYNDHLISQNRDSIQQDLVMLAVKAEEYAARPSTMAGGGHSFANITANAAGMALIAGPEYIDNENGTYSVQTAGTTALVILQGVGKVQLPDGTFPTYYCRVRDRKYLMQTIN